MNRGGRGGTEGYEGGGIKLSEEEGWRGGLAKKCHRPHKFKKNNIFRNIS